MEVSKQKRRKLTEFGIKVKKRLLDLNMDQKELASDLGVSESYLADVLRGNKKGLKYVASINHILDHREQAMKEEQKL